MGRKTIGELYLIHTFAFESGNLCARWSEMECITEKRAKGRRKGKCDSDGTCVSACVRKRHNVAIIIDMLACKRCLLYVCQCTVVVAIIQGRAPSLVVPEFSNLSMPKKSIDVALVISCGIFSLSMFLVDIVQLKMKKCVHCTYKYIHERRLHTTWHYKNLNLSSEIRR